MSKAKKQSSCQQQRLDVKNVAAKKHTLSKDKLDLQIRLPHYFIHAPIADLNGIKIDIFLNNSHLYILLFYMQFSDLKRYYAYK